MTAERRREWGGKLVGMGNWPLGSQADCRMWIASEFGPTIYAAKGFTIQIEYGQTRDVVQVDPGAHSFKGFIKAMEQARAYAMRRSA